MPLCARFLARSLLAVALAVSIPSVARAAPSLPALHAAPAASGGRIVDARGREVILRGVNVNALAEYWKGTRFRTTFPLEAKDPRRLRAFGWNAVRLLVSWSRIEPAPGRYDARYLARVRATAERLTEQGLYVFIDFHQDAWGPTLAARAGERCPTGSTPALGWDGAPGWATLVSDRTARCAPGVREGSPAVREAWGAFWADAPGPGGVGIRRRFVAAVARTVRSVGGLRGVAGYDVLNEPNALGAAESVALGRLYAEAVPAIRKAERRAGAGRRPILFEPSVLWSLAGAGAPPVFPHDSQIVYAPHIYTGAFDNGPVAAQTFTTARTEARAFGGAPVLTGEWGGDPSRSSYMRSHLDLQDRFGISSTQWTWRESCGDPHQRAAALAGGVSTTFALNGLDCADNSQPGVSAALRRTLTRGFVRAAPGRLVSMRWAKRRLRASGARARRGQLVEAFYPGRPRIAVRGLRSAAFTRVPGGSSVTATTTGRAWELRLRPGVRMTP